MASPDRSTCWMSRCLAPGLDLAVRRRSGARAGAGLVGVDPGADGIVYGIAGPLFYRRVVKGRGSHATAGGPARGVTLDRVDDG